jgi:tetratricopeptide (TPR) repeat protein/AraC-like DNA-binding protein
VIRFGPKAIIVIFCFFYLCPFAFPQNRVDSLLNELIQTKSKSNIYNQLAEAVLENSSEQSLKYVQLALNEAKLENNILQKGVAFFNLAEVFVNQYEADSAIYYYTLALPIFKQINDDYYISYTLNNLGWISNQNGSFKQAIDYYLESLNFLDYNVYPEDLANVYVNIGNSYHQLGNYYIAIEYFNNALSIVKTSEDKSSLPFAWNGIGLAYKYLACYDSALYYYRMLLDFDKIHGTERELAIDFQNIGSIYFDWHQYNLAEEYYLHAWQIYKEKGTKNDVSFILNNLGKVNQARQEYEKALEFYQQALAIDQETGIKSNLAIRFNNLGAVYFEIKRYSEAETYFKKSLAINDSLSQLYNKGLNYKNLGNVYIKTGNYKTAENMLEKGLGIASEIGSKNLTLSILESFADLNKTQGRYEDAFDYFTKYSALKDSLFTENNQKALADMHAKYQVDEKDQQIELLNNQKEIETLRTNTFRKYLIQLVAGIFIISGLLIFLYRQYRLKNKAYKKLVSQNLELLERNCDHNNFTNVIMNSSLTDDNKVIDFKQEQLYYKLSTYFKKEKSFLREDLNINEVAKDLDTNAHYISEVINKKMNNNFNGLINEYRVKESCRLLSNPANDNLTIESIARQSGFKSKSVFNQAFKSVTGLTPSYFKKLALKS